MMDRKTGKDGNGWGSIGGQEWLTKQCPVRTLSYPPGPARREASSPSRCEIDAIHCLRFYTVVLPSTPITLPTLYTPYPPSQLPTTYPPHLAKFSPNGVNAAPSH